MKRGRGDCDFFAFTSLFSQIFCSDDIFSITLQRKNDIQGLQKGLNHVPMSPYCPHDVIKAYHIYLFFK